jgi:MYXO-CTERM domain-containing protein
MKYGKVVAMVGVLAAMLAGPAAADTYVWNTGSGDWSTLANWLVGGSVPGELPDSDDDVVFYDEDTCTMDIDAAVANVSVSYTDGQAWNRFEGSTKALSFSGQFTFDLTYSSAYSKYAYFRSMLAGDGQFVMQSGEERFENSGNTWSGGTVINGGNVYAMAVGAMGTGDVTINGGLLHAEVVNGTLGNGTTLTVTVKDTGTYYVRNSNTVADVVLDGGTLKGAAATVTGDVNIVSASKMDTQDAQYGFTHYGIISGGGRIDLFTGPITFGGTGPNTYTGDTHAQSGKLSAGKVGALGKSENVYVHGIDTLQLSVDNAIDQGSVLYLLSGSRLILSGSNTVYALNIGATWDENLGKALGGTWIAADTYTSAPVGYSDYFSWGGGKTLTVLNDGPPTQAGTAIPEPAGLGLLGLGLLALRRRRA